MALMLYGKLFALLPTRPNIDLVLCDFEKKYFNSMYWNDNTISLNLSGMSLLNTNLDVHTSDNSFYQVEIFSFVTLKKQT